MTIEVRLLLLLREFASDRGYALDEGSLATIQIPIRSGPGKTLEPLSLLEVPIVELTIAEAAACTP
jgi:hypothetical protein